MGPVLGLVRVQIDTGRQREDLKLDERYKKDYLVTSDRGPQSLLTGLCSLKNNKRLIDTKKVWGREV